VHGGDNSLGKNSEASIEEGESPGADNPHQQPLEKAATTGSGDGDGDEEFSRSLTTTPKMEVEDFNTANPSGSGDHKTNEDDVENPSTNDHEHASENQAVKDGVALLGNVADVHGGDNSLGKNSEASIEEGESPGADNPHQQPLEKAATTGSDDGNGDEKFSRSLTTTLKMEAKDFNTANQESSKASTEEKQRLDADKQELDAEKVSVAGSGNGYEDKEVDKKASPNAPKVETTDSNADNQRDSEASTENKQGFVADDEQVLDAEKASAAGSGNGYDEDKEFDKASANTAKVEATDSRTESQNGHAEVVAAVNGAGDEYEDEDFDKASETAEKEGQIFITGNQTRIHTNENRGNSEDDYDDQDFDKASEKQGESAVTKAKENEASSKDGAGGYSEDEFDESLSSAMKGNKTNSDPPKKVAVASAVFSVDDGDGGYSEDFTTKEGSNGVDAGRISSPKSKQDYSDDEFDD